jgi:hypothetical protein
MHSLGKMQDQNSRSDAEKMRDALGDVTLGKMREMRKSIAIDQHELFSNNLSAKKSIQRASVSFQLAPGTEAGGVIIEN